jgi:electron transfer flavoprotein alpha subunit
VHIADTQSYEDVAHAAAAWASSVQPWAILATSTAQGREVASRVAASIGAGLTGDAAILEVIAGRLVAWKPAFGGQLVAAVTATSAIQMATVRAGVLPLSGTREHIAERSTIAATPRGRVRVQSRRREDSVEVLDGADVVIGVGQGVSPDEIHKLDMLAKVLGAELGCTRKVTDAGWMPHARQIGVTGRAIAPRLYVAIGTSGKFNHMVGVRAAHTVLAINPDPDALVWQHADIGVVARFQDCVPLLVDELRQVRRNAS